LSQQDYRRNDWTSAATRASLLMTLGPDRQGSCPDRIYRIIAIKLATANPKPEHTDRRAA
jgi:hypothetical protein